MEKDKINDVTENNEREEELYNSLSWVVKQFEKVLSNEPAGNVVESLSYAHSLLEKYKPIEK